MLLVAHNATATIASGQTTSDAVDGRHHAAWLAVLPAAFTGTQLSFLASADGTTYRALKTTAGVVVAIDAAAATAAPLPPEVGHARWFKIVSNASEAAARTILLTAKPVAPAPVRAGAGGGGTEYAEGDADASITGTAVLWEDAADTLRPVSAAKPLPVAVVSGGGGGTQYTEDAAAAADPVGTMGMAVRADSLAAVTSTDGDNVALRATNKGELYVKHADVLSVAGSWVDTELTAKDYDTGAGTVDTAVVGIVVPAAGGPVSITGDAANGLDVDITRLPGGTVAGASSLPAGTNNIGDVDVLSLPALPAGSNNIGDVDVLTLPALVAGTANIGDVDVLTLPALPAGSNNIGDVDVLTLPALTAGTNRIGSVRLVDSADADLTAAKNAQATRFLSITDAKDGGRNQTNYWMNIPVVTTATDALQSLTGYKGGAAVGATTTPAVVTAAKTYRITGITITYVAIATAGSVKFTLRFNLAGTVVIGSPAVVAYVVGGPAAVAGVAQTVEVSVPDGLEFPAGGGLGVSMVGLNATQVAAATGYAQIAINGFEY